MAARLWSFQIFTLRKNASGISNLVTTSLLFTYFYIIDLHKNS